MKMSAGGTFRQTWEHSNVSCLGFDFDFRRGLWLRLWRTGVAFAEAIGTISSLRTLYPRLDGSRSYPAAIVTAGLRAYCPMVVAK